MGEDERRLNLGAWLTFAAGVLIMTLSLCGLRHRLRWSWNVLLVTILLVGWNDAITSYSFGMLPVPLVPATLAAVGLYLARRPVFAGG